MASLPAEEETSFLRTEDFICLSCLSQGTSERLCLAAESFGNRMCSVECISQETPPPNMPPCVFILEQALSVRALQEMLSISSQGSDGAGQSGHKTLLYGHAIRLKHRDSNMYLACLSTSTSQDKLAFDVGLQVTAEKEACWWTIHPASKQRSVGEKVRIGDDLIVVSVSSERYLHVYGETFSGHGVIASFQQTLWTVLPVSSGAIRQKSMNMVFGGDVVRLFHGDESLTVSAPDSEDVNPFVNPPHNGTVPGGPPSAAHRPSTANPNSLQNLPAECSTGVRQPVMYEIGAVSTSARSLWRIEHLKTKWSAGFFSWASEIRLRHVTTGRYLGVAPAEAQGGSHCDVITLSPHEASEAATIFLLRPTKDDKKRTEEHGDEGMGEPDLRLGETLTYLQHAVSGRWLSYEAYETRKRGLGRVEEKKAVLLVEGHMDDLFTLVRAQDEETKSAAAIRRCTAVFSSFVNTLRAIAHMHQPNYPGLQSTAQQPGPQSPAVLRLSSGILLGDVTQCLEDLIEFFAQPDPHEEHEVRQAKLAALRNRQNLFQNEGMIGCVLNTIEHFTGTFQTRREFSLVVGEDKSEQFDRLGNYLYLLLAALIRGNRENCAQFATPSRLDWLFNRLELQEGFAEGVLDALHCVLTDSDEALYLIHERHIRILISLLDKQGRDPRVLQALCSLCMGRQGGAVRLNQDLIYNTLLPQRDLLLQTKLVDQCGSMRPNIFVGIKEGGSMYPKWYFEVLIDTLETVTHQPAQIRVGWANTEGYDAQPGGGAGWGATSLGDDLYSYAFDGKFLWAGGKRKQASIGTEEAASDEAAGGLKIGDVIGCLLDLAGPVIQFNVNGRLVRGYFQDFNTTGLFYPCISMNAKTNARFLLGSNQGRLRHGPPPGYAPICDARQPGQRLRLEPVFSFGQLEKSVFTGPLGSPTPQQSVFVPRTVRTSHRRDDQQKLHPCLTTFNKLPNQDRQYNVTLAYETLRTIVGLGYNITYEPLPEGTRMKTIKLSNSFTQPNGYKPQPLDLSQIVLSKRLESLVNQLAENTHNMWARDRISLGWTYGFREDHAQKRSPHLVPFNEVDPVIKHSNRETAIETVKTLLAYGYSLDQVSTDSSDAARSNLGTDYSGQTRTYRGQVTRAVTRGKWYYEVEVLTSGFVHVGWVKKSARPDAIIGLKSGSYAFAAHQARKWHRMAAAYGSVCQPGDVIGCMLDMIDKTISFSLNGELMMDPLGLEIAFKGIKTDEGYVPAFSLGSGQQVKVNFGNDVQTLKFFTFCGLQEGYKPLCVNMCRPMPMWYVRDDASLFKDVDSKHPTLQVIMSTGNTPSFKVMGKQADNGTSDETHFLRLSLGTRCRDQFTTKSLKERHVHLDSLRRHVEPEPTNMLHSAAGDDPSSYNMMGSGMSSSALEIRDRRAKKTRLGNMFKKGKSRELSPDVTSTVGGGGGSLVSGGGSNLVSTGGKRGGQTQVAGGSIGPGPMAGGGGQSSAGSGSLVSGTPGSVISSTHQGFQQTVQSQQPVSSEIMTTGVSSGQRPGGLPSSQVVGISTAATGQLGMPGRSYGLDELDVLVPDASGHLSSIANMVDEFCFTVLVLPGQDPGLVHIGWVTNYFKLAKPPGPDSSSLSLLQEMQQPTTFDTTTGQPFTQGVGGSQSAGHWANCVELFNVRQVAVCLLESDLTLKSAVAERASFMVNLGQLLSQVATPEDMGKRMSQGLSITCWVDVATGTLGFDLNGRDTGIRFQVEPSTRLFAAVFYRPTVREAIHFEFNRRNRYTLPITASMLRPPRQASIQPPHRLKVQALQRLHWARVPSRTVKMYSMKISEQRGWSTILEDHVSELAVQLPESGRCVTALELDEMVDLLKFHSHTLELYRALCCHANHNVAQSLTNHVDEHQLLHVLTAAVAARRTREFRCPAAVQMASLLRMPGPGGPTGRLEEGVDVTPLPIDESVVVAEDESEGVETNRCAEEVKDLLRRFHQHLTDKLGVMKPESEDEPGINERGGVSSMADHAFGENDHVYSITHAPDNLSLVSFGQVYPPDDLQTALARLPLVPPGMGNPEEGSGVPPWILKAAWDLLFRRRGPKDTAAEQAAIQLLEEASKLQQKRKSNLSDLIVHTIVKWARSGYIENLELIRAMFLALYRQYNAIEEVRDALGKTYVISSSSVEEVASLLRSLGRVRCLLGVQLGSNEEMLLKNCLWDLMNNKIFFQHPDLIRCLAVHETVMQLMVQTLTKATLDQPDANVGAQAQLAAGATSGSAGVLGPTEMIAATAQAGTGLPVVQEENLALNTTTQSERRSATGPTEMVVQCCRFLCYFCRTSRGNQKAMFEHLSYMLENSSMLLARPSLRGTCPLDVAYSSLMDNNELALALREKQLEKVAVYLSRCGVQSNAELLSKGYPDIGWDPVEGERFLDFLRFTVWVNGETVEENANLVVRLLIRRPECLGPALRGGSKTMKPQTMLHGTDGVELPPGGPGDTRDSGETLGSETENQQTSAGGGLLKAMKEGLVMSAQIKLVKMAQEAEAAGLNPEEEDLGWRTVMMDYEDANLFVPLPYNFESLPPEDNPDYVDLGAAILNFHSVLVNLLGHCAPELETTKSESLRARSILQSLVSMNDLEGVLSLRFILPPPKLEVQTNEDGAEEWVDKAGMPPGLLPEHKAAVVLFLERVYGISDATAFQRLLENGFLPDLRAATLLDSAVVPDSDMALALNRYLCNNVLTLLTRHAHFLHEEGTAGGLFEATLQTAYRLSKCRAITNHQRDIVCEFLIALMQQIRPPMMTALLRKMAVDLHSLSSESVVSLRVLTEFYQRCGTYYTSDGWTDESGSSRAVGTSGEQEASKQSVGDSLSGGANRGAGSGGESVATEEERNLTAQLFIIIFDNLSRQPYEPVLFSYALPCLCAIGCALPPDYSISRLNANDPRAALGQDAEEGGFSAFSAAIGMWV
ncbi:hypothetical protein AHF37_01425 [Paragonimus kellicotti]|nr:hypothetical protein AHF37_01425 [Paragonimus kellicotti]